MNINFQNFYRLDVIIAHGSNAEWINHCSVTRDPNIIPAAPNINIQQPNNDVYTYVFIMLCV